MLGSSLTLVGGLVATPSAYAVDTTSPVVISEVYGGGGNTGATFTNDFIELYNNGSAAVDLSSWSIQYTSSTGTTWTNKTNLSGSIAPGQYYLVQEAAGTTVTDKPLPTPDVTGSINLSGTSGKVALVNNQTFLSGCAAACSTAAGVVDFVGFGAANDSAGGMPTPALTNTSSAQRKTSPFSNAGVNNTDFTVATPTPKAAPGGTTTGPDCGANPLPPECVPGPNTIQDIQGPGFISPLNGQTVTNVPGVVTAVRTATSRGFWIQETSPDTSKPNESSGIFVFSTAPASVGDSVLVSGKVQDFYTLSSGETVGNTSSLSVTEIGGTVTMTKLSSGNALPAALPITPTTVPDTFSPTAPTGNVEDINPIDPTRSAMEFWEAHEGMLVSLDDAHVVGPGKTQFGEIYVTTKPSDQMTPRGGTYIGGYDQVPTGRLLLSPVNGIVPPANVGDLLTGTTSGPVDWSTFGGYDIAATTVGAWQDNHLAGSTASPQASDQLAVATYNVENLAPSDPQSKYDALGGGVVTNLKSPDIISVEEIQDNSGATDDGTVAADATLTKLTAAITAAGGPAYLWKEIDPVNDQDGGQPGGNIRVVFLYNPDRVTFVDKTAGTSTAGVTVGTAPDGTVDLSVNPGRVDPTNTAWVSSRKPLTGEFVFQGKKVIVIANHLNSKGGDQNSDGRFQPPTRSSEVQRTQQATVLNGFVKSMLAVDPRANIVLAGDFNDYQFSGPVTTLTDNGSTLLDLINTLPVNERYTYVFNGVSQVLDHIFLSKSVTDFQYDVVHVNSEFANQNSDHDPQVVRIRPVAHASTQGTVALNPTSVHPGNTTSVTLAGWDANTALTIALDGTTAGTVTTDGTGAATYTLTVPAGTSIGSHTVSATTGDGVSASAALAVTQAGGTVAVNPTSIKAGGTTTVTLSGWAPRATLTVTLDGVLVRTTTTDGSGARTLTIHVSGKAAPGPHTVTATNSGGVSTSATLTVTANQGTVSLNPATTGSGGSTKVTLSGWNAQTSLAIALDGVTRSTVTTNGNGNATVTLVVPAGTSPGAHTVTATTSDGVWNSATLTITAVQLGTVSPVSGRIGRTVWPVLSGFAPKTTFSVSIDSGPVVTTVTTNKSGIGRPSFAIPAGLSVGSHTIVVTAPDGGTATGVLTVTG